MKWWRNQEFSNGYNHYGCYYFKLFVIGIFFYFTVIVRRSNRIHNRWYFFIFWYCRVFIFLFCTDRIVKKQKKILWNKSVNGIKTILHRSYDHIKRNRGWQRQNINVAAVAEGALVVAGFTGGGGLDDANTSRWAAWGRKGFSQIHYRCCTVRQMCWFCVPCSCVLVSIIYCRWAKSMWQ